MTAEELEAIDVGANIRRIREARGMTQSALAQKAGMTRPGVSYIEAKGAEANPSLASAVLIADALGVGVSELIAPKLPEPPKPDKKKFAKLKKLVKERMAVDEMVLVLGKGYISADEKLELRRISTEIINEVIRLYKKGALG